MRRTALAAVAVTTAAALAAATPTSGAGSAERAAASARATAVGIGLREWQLGLYRQRVRRGKVKFNITNLGQDVHDFVVRTRRGRILARTRELRAGERLVKRVRLRRPGRYVLFCSIADHEERGMKARLRVTKRRR